MFSCEYYIDDENLINDICTTKTDSLDAGFENIISKFKERKKPRVMIIHPGSLTSYMDVKSAMKEDFERYITDDKEVRYNSDTEDEKEKEKLIKDIYQIDRDGYDAICFVSGGNSSGYGLLHHQEVIRTILNMKTKTIGAIGHSDEYHIFDLVFNRSLSTPTRLGVELAYYANKYK